MDAHSRLHYALDLGHVALFDMASVPLARPLRMEKPPIPGGLVGYAALLGSVPKMSGRSAYRVT